MAENTQGNNDRREANYHQYEEEDTYEYNTYNHQTVQQTSNSFYDPNPWAEEEVEEEM